MIWIINFDSHANLVKINFHVPVSNGSEKQSISAYQPNAVESIS